MVYNPWRYRIIHRGSLACLRGGHIDSIVVGAALFLFALILFIGAVRIRLQVKTEKKASGIPEGGILYSDLNVPASPLFSQRFRLSGKPDYIVKQKNNCIPVEVKSGGGTHPHQNHILQLAAYCQILEDIAGVFVPEGVLVYNNIPYRISFNPKLRFELESSIKTMRTILRTGRIHRNHDDPRRCMNCSMKNYCSNLVQEGG